MTDRVVRTGTATPADQVAEPLRYVTVPVGDGVPALSVTLAYDRAAAVLDLGVFDPQGRFRGYSGGAREGFVITPREATPGYLPGPLPPGDWQVLLRLHEVPDAGVAWELRAATGPAHPAPLPSAPRRGPRPPPRALPAPPPARWLRGDLHAHTVHSDGDQTVEQLAVQARRQGLDFLAVTDHNTVSHHPHLQAAGAHAQLTLLPGQEVTTGTAHAGALGDIGWVDFREPVSRWGEHARERGGVLSLNHPVAGDCAWREPLPEPVTHVEAWHGSWDRRDPAALAWWCAAGGVPLGGTDVHRPARGDTPGHPTTWACVSAAHPTVLSALHAGHVALTAAPDAPALVRCEERLLAVDAEGLRCVPGAAFLARGAAAPGRAVPDARCDLGAGEGWHVLIDAAGAVAALTP